MKRRFLVFPLAALLLLPGCSAMLERSYQSSEDHSEYSSTEDSSIIRAETYRGLVDAILYFVDEHVSQGVIRLYNYTTDVASDLESACLEIVQEDPLSAYVVKDITYDFSRIVSYYEITVSFTYSHTAEELTSIGTAVGSTALLHSLQQAMSEFDSSLVLWLSNYSGSAESVQEMISEIYWSTPQNAFGIPEVSVSFYPEEGIRRIAEIEFQWPDSPDALIRRSEETVLLASELLEESPPEEGENYAPEDLAALLFSVSPEADPDGSDAPDDALKGEPSTQEARTLALELLFQLTERDVRFAAGTAGREPVCWLITETEDGFRHLLETEDGILLLTDQELLDLGYFWDFSAYPECAEPPEESPEEISETAEGLPEEPVSE